MVTFAQLRALFADFRGHVRAPGRLSAQATRPYGRSFRALSASPGAAAESAEAATSGAKPGPPTPRYGSARAPHKVMHPAGVRPRPPLQRRRQQHQVPAGASRRAPRPAVLSQLNVGAARTIGHALPIFRPSPAGLSARVAAPIWAGTGSRWAPGSAGTAA